MRNSSSIELIKKLKSYKNIYVYDSFIKFNAKEIKKMKLKTTNVDNGFNADLVILMNNHKSFSDLNIFNLLNKMNKPSIFIDTWHIFDPLEIKQIKGLKYLVSVTTKVLVTGGTAFLVLLVKIS